jgi:hypothetical protein
MAQAAYRGTATIVWGSLSRVAYSALPPWAISLYRHRPYPDAVTRYALRSMRRAALTVPASVRGGAVRPPSAP